ncbi:AmmeMemoRadiSam system radical SAM enzyme [soil metagenome]
MTEVVLPAATSSHPGRWWHALPDGRVQCDLCPRECKLHEGQRGLCFVRERSGHAMVLNTYGRSSGFCVDPIEKKPLNHFYPGSSVLSFGTAGCNLACKFCQNWDISKSRDVDKLGQQASPEAIAQGCVQLGAKSVAYTYNDPVIFAEYAMDVADACHAVGVKSVAVTAGYMHDAPRREFYAKMDAANVDLKGFTDAFYRELCAGELQPVLDTLAYIHHETSCWLEVTTLLIPGANDSDAEITALSQWMYRELGADVPLHFTAFHPDYKMTDRPATPPDSVIRARRIAMGEGLRYVYTGNVHDAEGGTTSCPRCNTALIGRDWHFITAYRLHHTSCCPKCDFPIAGRFEPVEGEFRQFGRRRIPVSFAPSGSP